MHPLQAPQLVHGPLTREVLDLPAMGPGLFLASMEGLPRGFWGRGERWVAWGGALARIELGETPEGSRFEEVRRRIDELTRSGARRWSEMDPRNRPRFFGGFAFLDDPGQEAVWEGFPAAAFFLPGFLLEGSPGGARLIRYRSAHARKDGPSALPSLGELGAELLRRTRDRISGRNGRPLEPEDRSRGAGGAPIDRGSPAEPTSVRRADTGDRQRWEAAVQSVLAAVDEGAIRKAVLSRFLDVRLRDAADPVAGLAVLRRENPRAHVFLMEPRPGRVFMGAAPEILAELRGRRFEATAVAGSMARGRDAEEDAARARRLLESAKDRMEHRLTAEEMIEVLSPRLHQMEVEAEPRVLRLARIQHLETVIRGQAPPGEDALSLVEALHPTPAVCGRPRIEALELIRKIEPFDRGWYAGPVGWVDPAGDGDFVPALRSAVGGGDRWRLFAGAGIVEGSLPDAEWEETDLKFEPALRALGVGGE